MTKRPFFTLAGFPPTKTRVRRFFDGGEGTARAYLEDPPAFRGSGFDLRTLGSATLVEGEYLECRLGDRKRIHLYADGSLLFRAAADSSLLAWATDEATFLHSPRLNPIALVESITSFAFLYSRIASLLTEVPDSFVFRSVFTSAAWGDARLFLTPGPVDGAAWHNFHPRYQIHDANATASVAVTSADVAERPEHTAFLLVRVTYSLFDVPENGIPYVGEKQGSQVIEPSLFAKN